MEYSILYIIINAVVMLLGVFAHFAKKKIKGETLDSIKSYFRTHLKSSIVTVLAAGSAFAGIVASGGLGYVASFLVGYSADSVFNKSADSIK